MGNSNTYILPAEWAEQSGIQLTWPHKDTDWNYMLDEVTECYINVAREIAKREKLFIVTPHPDDVVSIIKDKVNMDNVTLFECNSNDTWARDHGGITVIDKESNNFVITDFGFNGWGQKFEAGLDNEITLNCYKGNIFKADYRNMNDFILEGGSIEVDGNGSIMTTTRCLMSKFRNPSYSKEEIEEVLKDSFGVSNIIWIDNGYLAGDDTDSHIDTLARFCPNNTIAYVKCNDVNDEHYSELKAMEQELIDARNIEGNPYNLVALPMADSIVFDGERLPASYANFLIMNNTVLMPTYNQPDNDKMAIEAISKAFPEYEVVGIDCIALIKQHGSLHCITMQYPKGVL